jgi:hypothetical protein
MGYISAVRKCIHIEIRRKFNLIHEKEWTGDTINSICKRYGVPGRRITNGITDIIKKE